MILLRATTWTLSIWSHMDHAYQNGAKPSMKLYISEYLLFASCMGPKKQGFWPRINSSQMKLSDFESPSGDSSSKSANFGLSK